MKVKLLKTKENATTGLYESTFILTGQDNDFKHLAKEYEGKTFEKKRNHNDGDYKSALI